MQTNFAALSAAQKKVWSREVWEAARDQMFINKFLGTGEQAMIQRVTELTKTEKGDQCIIQLVADLVEDGVIGDNEREGNEEAMQNYAQTISIDLISHGVRNKGKLSDQKTVVDFRKYARNRLAYWLANRMDQLAFLTLSGIGYAFKNNGASRIASPFPGLSFAADVSAPTSKRGLMWDGTALAASNTSSIASSGLNEPMASTNASPRTRTKAAKFIEEARDKGKRGSIAGYSTRNNQAFQQMEALFPGASTLVRKGDPNVDGYEWMDILKRMSAQTYEDPAAAKAWNTIFENRLPLTENSFAELTEFYRQEGAQ